jgi:hypothetical protein
MPPKVIPPRLHVLIASEAPYAVVLARIGKAYCKQLAWDLETDTFALGHIHPGRIYELRSDLSADGRLMITLSLHQGTIISEVPSFNPIRFEESHGTWFGGGVWVSSNRYWRHTWQDPANKYVFEIFEISEQQIADAKFGGFERNLSRKGPYDILTSPEIDSSELRWNLFVEPSGRFDQPPLREGNWAVYSERLCRDGWRRVTEFREGGYGGRHVHERDLPFGAILRKLSHEGRDPKRGKGYDWQHHVLVNADKQEFTFEDWEWAEYDVPRDRILYAEKGKIFAVKLTHEGLGEPVELFDSTQYGRDPVVAPY